MLKPISSEKAVKMIDIDNTLLFQTDRNRKRDAIKKEVESIFKVKVLKVRTLIHDNKKFAFVRLKKEYPAIDVATKLGLI